MGIKRTITSVLGLVLVMASSVLGGDIYISQNPAGADTGSDCSNAHSAAWFNSNAIGGNTYHLCGTFTGTAGSTMLTPPSGSAGNFLSVIFENGAVMAAPYWGNRNAGAISLVNKSYVMIDGGTSGVIKNTANGTVLANQQYSQGIFVANGSHIEVANLVIQNIYVNGGSSPSASDINGAETNNIYIIGSSNNILIHHNVLKSARSGVRIDFNTNDQIDLHGNTIVDHCWGIMMGGSSGSPGDTATNTIIHDNDISGFTNWQCPANAAYCSDKNDVYHTDGIILWNATNTSPSFTPKIYNNYIHGSLGRGSATAYIYCTYGGGSLSNQYSTSCTICNNLLVNDSSDPAYLLWTGTNTSGHLIYNNTLIGRSPSDGIGMNLNGTGNILKNNIIGNVGRAILSYGTLSNVLASSNNNVFFNIGSSSLFGGNDGGAWYTWSQWQALGFDSASSTSDPTLNASYGISSTSSSAYSRGENFTSKGILFLNSDKANTLRPVSGAWDAGAYQHLISGSSGAVTGIKIIP